MSLVLFEVGEAEEAEEVGEEGEAEEVIFGKELNLNKEAVSCQSSA